MAKSLEIRVRYLIPEFLAHAHVLLGLLQPAGAVAFLLPESLSDGIDDLPFFVVAYLHL